MSHDCDDLPPPRLLEGIAQFNRGEFFEQHETLETLWREEQGEVRRLYQGILQIGVAMYHIQRGNHHGAAHMLRRGTVYLTPFAPRCQSVNVDALLQQSARVLDSVEQLGRDGLDRFDWTLAPRVWLVGLEPHE